MADERFNISLGLDTGPALLEFKKFSKQAVAEQKALEKRLGGMAVPIHFVDDAKDLDGMIKKIDRVRDRAKELKKEQKALGKLMSKEWDTMDPQTKSARGSRMKDIKKNIGLNENEQKQLIAQFRKITNEPAVLAGKLQDEIKKAKARLSAMAPSGAQLEITEELKQITGSVSDAQKKLAETRGKIKKIADEAKAEWKADKDPASRARKGIVVKMREKQSPLIEEEKRLQTEISQMQSRATKLRSNFTGAATLEYKKLRDYIRDLQEWLQETRSFQEFAEVQLAGAGLPLREFKTGYRGAKPGQRGKKKAKSDESLVQYDPFAGLDITEETKKIAEAIAKRYLARSKKNKGPSSGLLSEILVDAMVEAGAISARQGAEVMLARKKSTLALIGQALGSNSLSVREDAINLATSEAASRGSDGTARPTRYQAKTKDSVVSTDVTMQKNTDDLIRTALETDVKFTGIGVKLTDIAEVVAGLVENIKVNEDGEDEEGIDVVAVAQTLGDILTVMEESRDDDDAESITRNQYSADDKTNADRLSNQRSNVGLGSDIETEAMALTKQAQEKNSLVLNLLKTISLGSEIGGVRGNKVGTGFDTETEMNTPGISLLDYLGGVFPVQQLGQEDDPQYGGITVTADDFLKAFTAALQAASLIQQQESQRNVVTRLGSNSGLPWYNPNLEPIPNSLGGMRTGNMMNRNTETPAITGTSNEMFYGLENEFDEKLTGMKTAEVLARENAIKLAFSERAQSGTDASSIITELNKMFAYFNDKSGTVPQIGNDKEISDKIFEMIVLATEGARNPAFVPGTEDPNIGELVNKNASEFMAIFESLPKSVQDLLLVAEQWALFNGKLSDSIQPSMGQLSNLGLGSVETLMSTFEKMFDANNYAPTTSAGGSSTTGSTPGSYKGGPSVGMKTKPIVVSVLEELQKDFQEIYGGNFATLGGKRGSFDPQTFRPATEETKNPVEMSYGEAFVANRDAMLDFIVRATQRVLNSDITSALQPLDDIFEKATPIGSGASNYSIGEGQFFKDAMGKARVPESMGFNEEQRNQAAIETSIIARAQALFGGGAHVFEAELQKLVKSMVDAGYTMDEALEALSTARERGTRLSASDRRAPLFGDVSQGPLRPYSTGEDYDARMARRGEAERAARSQAGSRFAGSSVPMPNFSDPFISGYGSTPTQRAPSREQQDADWQRELLNREAQSMALNFGSNETNGVVEDIVAGLENGVSAKEGEIGQAGRDMGKALGDGFDDQIGRNSPAQYFIDAADDAAEGVIVGSQKRLKDLSDAGRALAESFNAGYSDQAKVNAIAKIQEFENAGNIKAAEALKKQMRLAPAEERKKPGGAETGFVLRGEKEVAERNKALAERLKELAASQQDLLVALDIESSGGLNAKDGKPGKRSMAYAYGVSAAYGVESEGRAAGNANVPAIVPQSEGLGFGMVVPPKDPQSGTRFTRGAAQSVGLVGENDSNSEILPNLVERIKSLGLGEENARGDEQAYVDQLQDIAFLLNSLYQQQIPLTLHNSGLSDLTTLGKEFANYGIAAPTGKQFEDAGLLVETQTMATMLKKLFGEDIPKSITSIYEFFTGKAPGSELVPKTGVKPAYTEATAVAHDPLIDAQASGVIAFSMRKMAEEVGAKQITITKAIADFVKASWTTVSDAIGGFRRFGAGKGDPKKDYRDSKTLKSYGQQTATHGGAVQPSVLTVPRRAPSAQPVPVQPTLFDDVEVTATMDEAEKLRVLEEQLAKLEEQREVEKQRIKLERERLKQLYEAEKVIEAMSENRGIGFDNLTNSPINNRVIQDKDKARLARNNAIVDEAKKNPELFAEVERQIASRWGKVPERFVATLGNASRELADAIQKAIDRVNRQINKIQVENGQRTPTPRGPRPPGGGGGNKPPGPRGPDDIPGGPDSPTPEYKDLMDGKISGNQHQAWIDQEIEAERLKAKQFAESQNGMNKAVKAHEKVVADANRKMVDSWISTRYSLYDVASTYEDMGKKLRVLTSYIREAVMVNSSYETSFTAVERVMQPLPDEIDGMRQRLVLMTQELPVAFDQLAKIATLGGQMGINADGINNFTEQVVKYSTITGMSADTVAEKFGRISQLADIPADDFDKLASAVAFAGINAVATDQEIITLTESIAAASNLAGFGADETIGLATAISSLGIAPEQARGVIVRLFGDIERGMQKGGKELDAYSKHLGLSAKETKNLWETDPQAFFKRMLQNLSTAGSMTTALDNLNIKETREVNTLQRLANNMDVYNQSMGDAQESYANGTFLADAYAKTQDNVAAKLEILNNQMKILQDNVGNAFAEGPLGLKAILDGLSAFMEFVNKITASPIGKVVVSVVAGLTAMIAIFVAYQVASYKATAATLAMKTAMVQLGKMGGENTGIKGLLDVLTGQERMIIDSNGRLRSITKDRLEEMEAMGKIVPEGTPVDRALKAGLDVRKAATPGSLDNEIAYNAGMTLGPRSDNAGQVLPNVLEEAQGPSIAQLQEQIAVNRQLIEIRMEIAQKSFEASTALRAYALAQGDAAMAEKAAADAAASSREINRLGNMDQGLEENLAALKAQSIDPEAVVPKEIETNIEQSTQSLNEMGAGLDSVATKADKGSVATTKFGKAVGFLSKAAGWITLVLTLVATATEIYKSFQINLEEAGGGLDSFREAIYKDTAAWKQNGEAIGTTQSKVTESSVGLTAWAKSMESTTGSSAKMTTAITETTDSITEQTLALGANSMEWLAQAAMADDQIQNMFKSYFNAGQDLSELAKQANINLQDMVGMALSDPGKGAQNYLRDWFTSAEDLRDVAPNLYSDLDKIASALDGTTKSGVENSKIMKALGVGFGEGKDGAEEFNNELDNTIARVYTLTDYVGDLSSILSAAFTIRYGKEEATDSLAASWENVKNRIDDAREAIEKIKDEIKSMTADRNILEYQLNIALKYGDTMRADKLRAELDAKDKELADKNKELGKSQDAASTSLVGGTQAAADNRAVMRGLVQDYNKYLEALANTATYEGLSDAQVKRKKAWLKQQADQAKADMLAKGAQLGFSENEMAPYVKSFKDFRTIVDKLPKELTLRVDADPGTRAFMEFWAKQNANGSSKKKDSSKTSGGTGLGPDGKPKKPMWTRPTTDKWSGYTATEKPVKEAGQGDVGLAGWSDLWGNIANIFNGDAWAARTKFDQNAVSAGTASAEDVAASEAYMNKFVKVNTLKAEAYNAEYEQRLQEWENAATVRQVKAMGGTDSDIEAMAKAHAKASPGAWNPFNGTFNPPDPKIANFTGTGPYPSRVPTSKEGQVDQKAKDIITGYQLNKGMKSKDDWTKYNTDTANNAESKQYEAIYGANLGENAASELKKSAALHASRYPGEYNPFSRTQNPWPKTQQLLQAKGLTPLKDQAALHAALHPGEYNPYSGKVNTMPADQKMVDAMKDKKTRTALGVEHARLYPGEYNPYTNTVNPMFNKDVKKGTRDIADKAISSGGQMKAAIDAIRADDKRAAAKGAKKADPIYAYITGSDVKTNFAGGKVGYASGGLIPGKSPQNPRSDNLLASGPGGVIGIRSGEFIQSQPAVQYYGLDFMNAINNLQIPRYASGGMIGSVSGGGTSVVELSPSAVMQIMAIANRPVNLYSDDRQIASSANRGNMLLAMRGSN